jgi:hypothetical protein
MAACGPEQLTHSLDRDAESAEQGDAWLQNTKRNVIGAFPFGFQRRRGGAGV